MSKGNERKERVVVKCALSRARRRIWCVTAAAGLAQSGKYQVSSISGESISRYKPPRTYEIRVEKRERKREKEKVTERDPKTWHDRIATARNAPPIFRVGLLQSCKSSKK